VLSEWYLPSAYPADLSSAKEKRFNLPAVAPSARANTLRIQLTFAVRKGRVKKRGFLRRPPSTSHKNSI